jgi:hypothetical protein
MKGLIRSLRLGCLPVVLVLTMPVYVPSSVPASAHDYTADNHSNGDNDNLYSFPQIGDTRVDKQGSTLFLLTAAPRDGAIDLWWSHWEDPAIDSYVITYTYGTGGSDADQGASPISNIPPTVHAYSLTGVSNDVLYAVTVAARDENDANLAVSNSVRVLPNDVFCYLPRVRKSVGIYYVSPNGDDDNPGTESRPWATVHKAATTAVAGDTVIFENGTYDIKNGQRNWNSGSADRPITFQARNDRQAVWVQSRAVSSVDMSHESYITFRGLVIRGDNVHQQTALIRLEDCDHITIDDCEVGESREAHYGIVIRSSDDIHINDCTIHPNNGGRDNQDGIHMYEDNTNIVIENSEIYQCDHGGINVDTVDGLLIDRCQVYETGSHGISIGDSEETRYTLDNITIRDSVIHDSDTIYDHSGTWHANIRIHLHASNVTILRNELYAASCYGLYMSSELAGPVYIYNNTVYGQGLDVTTEAQVMFYDSHSLDDNVAANIYYKNNIVYVTKNGPKALYVGDAFEPWLRADNNMYYSSSATESIRREGRTYRTFAAYQAAGYEPHAVVSEDPEMNHPAHADFTLRAGSPAIDAGVDIGEPYSGSAPDIGAHEYMTAFDAESRYHNVWYAMNTVDHYLGMSHDE